MKEIINVIKINFKGLKHIWDINKGYVILSFIWPIIFMPIQLFEVYVIKYVTDGLVYGTPFATLLFIIISLGLLKLLRNFIGNFYNKRYQVIKNEEIEQKLRLNFLKKVSSLDIECFDNAEFYDKYVKALQEADSRYFQVLGHLSNFLYSLITLCAYFSLIISLDGFLIVFAVLPVLVTLIFSGKQNKMSFNFGEETVPIGRKVNYIMRIFYLSNYAKEIKLNRAGGFFIDKLKKYYNEYNVKLKKFGIDELKITLLEHGLSIVIPVLLQIYLVAKTAFGLLSVGSYAALESTTWQVSGYLQSVIQIIPQLKQNSRFLKNLDEILEYEPKIKDKVEPKVLDKKILHEISVKNLTFTYPNNEQPTLHNISMKIKPGEKIAIVGYNGAGKSTFIKLLMRLYDTSIGSVKIDGVDIKDYSQDSLRDNFGVAFQDFQYYAYNLAENILFKESDKMTNAEETKMNQAVEYAGLKDKIDTFNAGIYTMLTKEFDSEGAILSGGETQKLALARAFVKDCSILILDEPTSAMDPIAEDKLYKNMFKIAEGKTLIFISHKLSSAKMADRVFLFENGRIIESGSHEELMELNGKYAEMFNTQSSYYS
ncbi:MAG: ABC transporter ATP-binding protein [Ruminococcaceae bacterium]|nr:ABC transporter ATP-binding protein [Oscillospiraceae bacterium]